MKSQLIKIEIKLALFVVIILMISIFFKDNLLLLIFLGMLFSCFVICDYREYQESEEYINTCYKE